MKTCTIDECSRRPDARGLCKTHRRRSLRGGDMCAPIAIYHQRAGRVCVIDGCKEAVKARGYCDLHYTRWHRNKDMRSARRTKNKGRRCKAEGCIRWATITGFCQHCYDRNRYWQTQQRTPPPLPIESIDQWLARPAGQ